MNTIEMLRLEVLGDRLDTTKDEVLYKKLDDAKQIFLALKYPYENPRPTEVPTEYNFWLIMCAKELYNKNGYEGVTSYSENGMSISYSQVSSLLSSTLLSLIVPKAGVPK